jgi:hypothetical protein
MKKITYTAGLHGNEYMPVLALSSHKMEFLVGNPRALARGVRYCDRDLNASFGTQKQNYESKRAATLLRLIPKQSRVVDFHTSEGANHPFVIIVDTAMLPFARTLGVKRIVYMKHNIKGGRALINYRQGVSVEVGRHHEPQSFDRTIRIVQNVKSGRRLGRPQLYEVYGKITKPGRYINFSKHRDGFIPVLSGEPAYTFYGLKARRVKAFL